MKNQNTRKPVNYKYKTFSRTWEVGPELEFCGFLTSINLKEIWQALPQAQAFTVAKHLCSPHSQVHAITQSVEKQATFVWWAFRAFAGKRNITKTCLLCLQKAYFSHLLPRKKQSQFLRDNWLQVDFPNFLCTNHLTETPPLNVTALPRSWL